MKKTLSALLAAVVVATVVTPTKAATVSSGSSNRQPVSQPAIQPVAKPSLSTPQISSEAILMETQANKSLSLGEFGYDFVAVSEPQRVTVNQRDVFGQNNPMPAIQFLAQARQFVMPLGYFAYFYDADGLEVGFVPVELSPAGGSYQPNQRVRVTIPLILLDPNAQVQDIVLRRL